MNHLLLLTLATAAPTDRLQLPSLILSAIFMLCGALALLASILNWDWFFATASARALGGRHARRRARLLYATFGIALLLAPFLLLR